MYPGEKFKETNISRNNGLIALSEEGMNDLQDWSEGDIQIDLDYDEISNDVHYIYENIAAYNESHSDWDKNFAPLSLADLPLINHSLSNFSVFDIENIIDELSYVKGYVCQDKNGCIYELIA